VAGGTVADDPASGRRRHLVQPVQHVVELFQGFVVDGEGAAAALEIDADLEAEQGGQVALQRVRTKLEYTTIASQLAGELFSLSELQSLYEVVLDRPLDKRNFRRKLKLAGLVEPTGQSVSEGPGRPAQLYRFRELEFFHLRDCGIHAPF